MTFTRTASGLANYSRFHGVELIVFTEGKNEVDADHAPLGDQLFYEAVLSYALPGSTFKIKCVGNKSAALDYACNILKNKIKNQLVFVDRDLNGLTHSYLPIKCVVQTFGYSWENDLWTSNVVASLIENLTHTRPESLIFRYSRLEKRMRKLFILDAGMQIHSLALLDKKSATGGVNVSYSASQPVSLVEVKRIVKKYRNQPAFSCPVSSGVLTIAKGVDAQRVIQGHVWSNVVRGLLMQSYREQTNDTAPSKRVMLNLALAALKANVSDILGVRVANHYRDSVQAALS